MHIDSGGRVGERGWGDTEEKMEKSFRGRARNAFAGFCAIWMKESIECATEMVFECSQGQCWTLRA